MRNFVCLFVCLFVMNVAVANAAFIETFWDSAQYDAYVGASNYTLGNLTDEGNAAKGLAFDMFTVDGSKGGSVSVYGSTKKTIPDLNFTVSSDGFKPPHSGWMSGSQSLAMGSNTGVVVDMKFDYDNLSAFALQDFYLAFAGKNASNEGIILTATFSQYVWNESEDKYLLNDIYTETSYQAAQAGRTDRNPYFFGFAVNDEETTGLWVLTSLNAFISSDGKAPITSNGGFSAFGFGVGLYNEVSVIPPTTTPEPATFVMFGLGLCGLGLARRFGRK